MSFIKNKNLYLYLILVLFFSFFIFHIKETSASNINFSPTTSTYNVGDTIKIKILLSTNQSVNAVSGHISFSIDNLNIVSIAKNSSIINLWAQEPSFSNKVGSIDFEGVILGGYIGNAGEILTIIFKAKSEGIAYLNFSNVTILANDGMGTDIFDGDLFTGTINLNKKINIENTNKKILPTEKCEEISNNEELESLSCLVVSATDKIKEIEVSNTLPNNSLLIAVIVFCLILFVFIIVYLIALILKLKKYIRGKIIGVEKIVSRNFKRLEKTIYSDSTNQKDSQNFDPDKDKKILKDITKTEDNIIREIDKIENDL